MAPRRVDLRAAKDLEAIGSPVRLEILKHLQADGELTVFELARRMGRSTDGLYYHVRRLIEIGVLVRSGTRPAGRREEALLSLAGAPLEVGLPSGGAGPGAILETGRALLRDVEDNLRALVPPAVADGSAAPGTDGRDAAATADVQAAHSAAAADDPLPLLARMTARLSPEALAEVRTHLDAVAAVFTRHRPAPTAGAERPPISGPRHELTIFLLELRTPPKRG